MDAKNVTGTILEVALTKVKEYVDGEILDIPECQQVTEAELDEILARVGFLTS